MSEYKIKLEVFEGPLALLMHLIEKNKIDIYDIPIAVITEQYINYLRDWQEFNIDIASEFLVMAANLLQIKSRMLLPRQPHAAQLEDEEEDPRKALVDRLLEYRKFKQAALELEQKKQERDQYFFRLPQEFSVRYTLPQGLDLDILITAFAAVWEGAAEDFAVVAREEISVQDKMQDIVNLLHNNRGRLDFKETLIRQGSRAELIASFLALLELIRLKRVAVRQEKSFAAIYIFLNYDGQVQAQEGDLP
ncbi:segregation and condensation protein A [Propionispora hippei]|uniref:Segregation and condensation protein A n=1 Tax=Propionispora hippei DSM 15287 TaxID=1123003 RepID=A0A1M6ADK1_9FIRM|nr:segregation/condensation protein A [Propionispora hippei]SHI34535.1 condensin subunit ScpA [Propionispora hippei DSM 15287]